MGSETYSFSGKLIKICSKATKLFACVLVAKRSLELQLLDRLLHSQAGVDAQNKKKFSHMKFANFIKSSNEDHSLQCGALIKAITVRFGGWIDSATKDVSFEVRNMK